MPGRSSNEKKPLEFNTSLTESPIAAILQTPSADNNLASLETEDLEKGKAHTSQNYNASSTETQDPDLVTWTGSGDVENPKNWPDNIKWKYTIAVSLFVFISPVSSAMIAPAMESLGEELDMNSEIEVYLSLAIFVLAYSVGPIFFGPASELYGRVHLLQISNLWYIAWNLGCGFARNKSQFFAFRFLAGIGGSAPLALGGGAISDIWSAEQRGKAMGLYTLGPMLGPVVGPIGGGFIAEYTTWRWVFWSTSAAAAVVQLVGAFWLKESHPATLLRRKRNALFKATGNINLHTEEKNESLPVKLGNAVMRPARLFASQPIVTCISVYMAYLFGVTYLMFATFPTIWTKEFVDRIYKSLKAKNDDVGRTEFRMPCMMVGSVITTIGLFWYGWSIQGRVHWIMPNIGALIYTAGTISCLQGMQTYIVDCYQTYAASALAACAILRSLAGFGFPLFAPYLYQDLGYGWGTTVLAFLSIAIGWIAPFIFWYFGLSSEQCRNLPLAILKK
ncbi:unnamed protein product [Clonostachys rosea]|uniref:Major facilitator superfamily (MFS) profile domain-containing protein n=1 Tax=Bionectria ochroleuca TaxID=29856 RepID=A0ABY6UGE9_BIOOC|nr:unnamed protein product [Clonostachys rosea]